MALDENGNLWIVSGVSQAYTQTYDTLVTTGAHQTVFGGGQSDLFLSKFSPNGNLLYASYFGGAGDENGFASLDTRNGKVYLVGQTASAQDIATPGSYQDVLLANTSPNGNPYSGTGFLAQFDTLGQLQWSTYYQGNRNTHILEVKAGDNEVYIWGDAASDNLGTPGAFQENIPPPFLNNQGGYETPYYPILSKFDDTGQLIWATYYGPIITDTNYFDYNIFADGGLSLDALGNIYVGGRSNDTEGYYGTANSHQPTCAGKQDGFFSKFSASGQRLWSTYYGGTEIEQGIYIHIGRDDSFYITGRTYSTTGISTAGTYQTTMSGSSSTFLAKFDLLCQRQWGTYFNVDTYSFARPCYADANGNVFTAGNTKVTTGTATPGSWQENHAGKNDTYMIKFNPSGSNIIWGSYYGGAQNEFPVFGGTGFIVTANNEFYFSGITGSFSNIASEGAFIDDASTGVIDYGGFIAKFVPCDNPIPPTGDAIQYFQPGETLNDLLVGTATWSGSEPILTWYADSAGTTVLPNDIILIDGKTYYVSRTIQGCDESTLLGITVFEDLGVGENNQSKIQFYPNPNNGHFILTGLKLTDYTFQLFDLNGSMIYQEKQISVHENHEFSLTNKLASGMYILKMETEDSLQFLKILVK